jgi:hypothetical protein
MTVIPIYRCAAADAQPVGPRYVISVPSAMYHPNPTHLRTLDRLTDNVSYDNVLVDNVSLWGCHHV